jgi:adenosylcobyric acid synthase
MIQGTASSVGKSLLVTALCRYFQRLGVRVAPFKAQNMALNSFVTPEGLEIGRAQAVQAEACRVDPSADMNPVLLKCESDQRVQVVVLGKATGSMTGQDYYGYSRSLRPAVTGALNRLREKYELVILEGAGSPAEVNLQDRDLANMFAAEAADAPVLLVGDIDKGGVFASLLGTLELLKPADRIRVKGLLINKFRGNLEILKPGLSFLEQRTGLPLLGVLPYLSDLGIAEEDSTALEEPRPYSQDAVLQIGVLKFPRISNFDDFQPLEREKSVRVQFVQKPHELEGMDLIILPGTKSTVDDLKWLWEKGFEEPLRKWAQGGRPILGICGGYQMLGEIIEDPYHVESNESSVKGLGLLPVTTRFEKEKITAQVEAFGVDETMGGPTHQKIKAYEIHMGRVNVKEKLAPLFKIISRNGQAVEETEGVIQGSVSGTLLHGLFENDSVRSALLTGLGKRKGLNVSAVRYSKETEYDRLADMVQNHLDTTLLDRIMGKA